MIIMVGLRMSYKWNKSALKRGSSFCQVESKANKLVLMQFLLQVVCSDRHHIDSVNQSINQSNFYTQFYTLIGSKLASFVLVKRVETVLNHQTNNEWPIKEIVWIFLSRVV